MMSSDILLFAINYYYSLFPEKDHKLTNGGVGRDDDKHHGSRYDPRTMHRITDITDLVDDSSADSDDDDAVAGSRTSMEVVAATTAGDVENGRRRNNGSNNNGGGFISLRCRRAIIVVSLIAIIAAASLAIGFAVTQRNPGSRNSNPAFSVANEGPHGEQPEQHLLEIAERVISACSESSLDSDMSDCQKLCHTSMCCFESGDYSCEEDESKDCAVYAGCEALIEGILIDAAEEDEG